MKTSKRTLLPLLPLIPMLLAVPAMVRTAAAQYTSSPPVENDSKDFDRGASLVMEGEFEQALPLLDKAAQGGNVMAQYLTAKLIRRGFGTPKDLDRAIRLLRSACAGQTFPEALLELGQALEEANADSAEWTSVLKRASAAGNSGASLELGNAYFLGSQIQRDLPMAFAWYSLAADQNNPYAINNLRAVQQNITDEQRAHGQRILEELRSASRQGTAGGTVQFQFDLNSAIQAAFDKGRKAYEGRNLDEARRRLEPLARSRNPGALFYVARMHETGRGYDQDYLEAARLYAVAIQQGEGTSLGNLARLFKQGLGVSKSPNAAATLYYGAAWRGDADAQNEYGLAAIQGAGVERDPIAAYVWWTLASEAGNEHAKNNLPILLQQDLPQEKRAAADAQLADVRKKRAQGFAPAAPNLDLGTPRLMAAGAKVITKKYSSGEEVVVDSDDKKEHDKKGDSERGTKGGLETWRSPDGTLLAKKPAGWSVQHGDLFGGGTYGCTIQNKDETAGVLFVVMPGAQQRFQNSSEFAQAMLDGISGEFENFRVTNRIAAPDGSKVRIDATFVDEGKPAIGTFQFSLDAKDGRMMALGAETQLWKSMEAQLQDIALSIRYPAPAQEGGSKGGSGGTRRF